MGIPVPGQPLASGQSTFRDDILKIELSGPSRQHECHRCPWHLQNSNLRGHDQGRYDSRAKHASDSSRLSNMQNTIFEGTKAGPKL